MTASLPHTLNINDAARERRPRPLVSVAPDSFFVAPVLESIAHLGVMKVGQPGACVWPAIAINSGMGGATYGARTVGHVYPPGTSVLCFKMPNTPHVFILGVVNNPVVDKAKNMVPGWIVPGSSAGLGFDRVHWGSQENPKGETGDINYAGGRPCDALPGDVGYINELGVGYGIGRTMAWLRASYFCGIEANWLDNYLQLFGDNMSIMLSGSESRSTNDNGEFNQIHRWGPYPWETLGAGKPTTDAMRDEKGTWTSGLAGVEPKYDDQAGLWRVQEFKGYLGDLQRTYVSLPALDDVVEQSSAKTVTPGLSDVGVGIDGSLHFKSAKSILLEKTVAIPIPKELRAPDDPMGDIYDDYKHAGLVGDGPDHEREEPAMADDKPGMRALLGLDRQAVQSYLSDLALRKHTKDWYLPTEQETVDKLGMKASYDPDGEINNRYWLPTPKKVEKDLDHRGKANFYTGRAFMQIEDDGSIIIEDAYGSQIRMEGGNIVLAARNDVILQPGRNLHAWAPRDLVMKAGNSADLSASLGDVRIKAEGNLLAVAVKKGVVIESQSDDQSDWNKSGQELESRGIVFRAPKANIIALSNKTYIRSGVEDGSNGGLHLDAGNGKCDVTVRAANVITHAVTSTKTLIGSEDNSDSLVSMDLTSNSFTLAGGTISDVVFSGQRFTFGSPGASSCRLHVDGRISSKDGMMSTGLIVGKGLYVDGEIIGQSGLWVKRMIATTSNVICKNIAADDGGSFLPQTSDKYRAADNPPPEHPTWPKTLVEEGTTKISTTVQTTKEADNQTLKDVKKELYDANSKLADDNTLKKSGFSFRTDKQYSLQSDFRWFESRWQMMNRMVFGVTKTWEEKPVKSPVDNADTYPFPGKDAWTGGSAFVKVDPSLYDVNSGTSKDLSESREYPTPETVSFETGYVVTEQQ